MAGTVLAVPACHHATGEMFWPRALGRAAKFMMLTLAIGRILEGQTLSAQD